MTQRSRSAATPEPEGRPAGAGADPLAPFVRADSRPHR